MTWANDGVLTARRVGRHKFCRASELAWAAIRASRQLLEGHSQQDWDGRWTLVQWQFVSRERAIRDQAATLLRTMGFARLGPGVFVHPRPTTPALQQALNHPTLGERVIIFRGALENWDPAELAAGLWEFEQTDARYRAFLARHEPLLALDTESLLPVDAFIAKFAVVVDFLAVAWQDADLPPELLPGDWTGRRAREVAAELNRRLLPLAVAHGDALMARIPDRRLQAELAASWKERIDDLPE